jgi:hypothetical protein
MGRVDGIFGSLEAEFQRCVHTKERGPMIGQACTTSGIDVNVFSRMRPLICEREGF